MHARELTADGAAGPSALHLDQIPAEVHAGELAPCLSPQGRRARGPAAPPTCAARPLQVLQACAVRMACGYTTGGLAQAFLLPTVCRRAPHLPAQEAATSLQQPCLGPGARRRRFKEALEQPFWSVLPGVLTAKLWWALGRPGAPLPLRATSVSKRFFLLPVHKQGHGRLCFPLNRALIERQTQSGVVAPAPLGRRRHARGHQRPAVAQGARQRHHSRE